MKPKVVEVPIEAVYGNEKSGVSVLREALPFLWKSLRNTVKRLLYCYFLRGFSIASMLLTTGVCAVLFGLSFGIYLGVRPPNWPRREPSCWPACPCCPGCRC